MSEGKETKRGTETERREGRYNKGEEGKNGRGSWLREVEKSQGERREGEGEKGGREEDGDRRDDRNGGEAGAVGFRPVTEQQCPEKTKETAVSGPGICVKLTFSKTSIRTLLHYKNLFLQSPIQNIEPPNDLIM